MSKAIYLVLCLNFLIILQLHLTHSANIKRSYGSDHKTPVGKHRQARSLNWKQCSWNILNSDLDEGIICECPFDKEWSETHLHVIFKGNMQVLTASTCNRWFITFNGAECSTPVDAMVYAEGGIKTNIEGFCPGVKRGSLNKGSVKVALNVGLCSGYAGGDVHTGLGAMSRIIVEEIEPPKES